MATYKIIDNQTGRQIGKDYTSRTRAHRRADKLDLDYGAVRYIVRTIFDTNEPCDSSADATDIRFVI